MSFLQFHAIATQRGDGLHPKLEQLFERLAAHGLESGASGPEGGAELQQEAAQPVKLASLSEHGSLQPKSRRSA